MTEKKSEVKVPYWKQEKHQQAIEALRKRYSHLHPLVFHRSMERASGMGDLFDILEAAPSELPITWDAANHCWRQTEDLFRAEALVGKEDA